MSRDYLSPSKHQLVIVLTSHSQKAYSQRFCLIPLSYRAMKRKLIMKSWLLTLPPTSMENGNVSKMNLLFKFGAIFSTEP